MNTTNDETTPERPAEAGAAEVSSGPAARWWLAVVAGTVIALPLGWLLADGAQLPFYLGLFFFMLFGILIGAVTHRIAAAGRPYRTSVLVVGTTLLVAVCWLTSIIKESSDLPEEMAYKAGMNARDLSGRTIDEYRADLARQVDELIDGQYPPGGTLGYVRWIMKDGIIGPDEIAGLQTPVRPRQRGLGWTIRVVLSIALLGWGVGSQTLPLHKTKEKTHRAIDD